MGRTMAPDMTGRRFGHLLVIAPAGTSSSRQALWRCLCLQCGSQHVAVGQRLRNGKTRSCGCAVQRVDMTGQVFGRWTVESHAGRSRGSTLWRCRCACGTVRDVPRTNLTGGKTTSCGCRYGEAHRAAKAAAARQQAA